MNMIIDDDFKERCKRKNLFNIELKYIRIGADTHKIYGIYFTVGYSESIREIGSEHKMFINESINFGKKKRRKID